MKRVKPTPFSILTISKLTILSLLGIFLFVFWIPKKNTPKETNLVPFSIPKIIGIKDTTTLCLSPMYMLNAWYNIERLDSITGVLDLSKPPKEQDNQYYQFQVPSTVDDNQFSNDALRVVVDTINELSMTKKPIWASSLFHRFFYDSVETLQDDTLIQQVKSFPIYITNLSAKNVATLKTQDGSIMMVVQALDQNNQWKPIEYWSNSWCGNSYFTYMIPPRHMLMTRGIKCSGDFYTKCRLKVSNNSDSIFSNEFHMSINETQFENPIKKDQY